MKRAIDWWLMGLPIALLTITGFSSILIWRRLPPELPWFFSLPWGETQLVSRSWFGLGLLAIGLVNAINLIIASRLCRRDEVVTRVVEGANLLLTLMYLVSFWQVALIMI